MKDGVLRGIEPFMTFTVHSDAGPITVGKLWCKDGAFSFEGLVDVSSQIFFDMVVDRLNNPTKYSDGS